MIAIADYGAGNLSSVKKALDQIGAFAVVTSDPAVVAAAQKIILPGVGHFSATAVLEKSGLKAAIRDAIGREVPFLGICVGMQWMFETSEESPETLGLGLFPGECQHFPKEVKSPHVGWNDLSVRKPSRLLHGISGGSFVYFTHSYRVPVIDATVAESEYGGAFSAVVERERAFGVQFHPEKSGFAGLKLLENFYRLPC
ncbi:MAG: imidazole glycerol phosphate synthase subunit HisH [Terriglobales bacterium]